MSTVLKQDTGLFPGTKRAAYELIDGINFSSLKYLRKTPAHFRCAMTSPPESTKALEFGHCYHLAMLEPDRFKREVVRGLEGIDKRTKVGKNQWAEFTDANHDKEILLPDEYDQVSEMQAVMMQHDTARELLTAKGRNEIALVWDDAETGERCKGMIDKFCGLYSYTFVIDLKSTKDAAKWAFASDVMKYSYHAQAAMYLDGLSAIAPADRRFVHICQEKEPPFAVIVYELDEGAIVQGRKTYREWLKIYAECRANNAWPAYLNGFHPISLPRWAQNQGEEL